MAERSLDKREDRVRFPPTAPIPCRLAAGLPALTRATVVRIHPRELHGGRDVVVPACLAVNEDVRVRFSSITLLPRRLMAGRQSLELPVYVRIVPGELSGCGPMAGHRAWDAAMGVRFTPSRLRAARWGAESTCNALAVGSIPTPSTTRDDQLWSRSHSAERPEGIVVRLGRPSARTLDSKSDERGSTPRRPALGRDVGTRRARMCGHLLSPVPDG